MVLLLPGSQGVLGHERRIWNIEKQMRGIDGSRLVLSISKKRLAGFRDSSLVNCCVHRGNQLLKQYNFLDKRFGSKFSLFM
jgi:hypothetical protein